MMGVFRDRCGSVAAEFAMALPVLVLIALAGVDIARFALLYQKLGRTAGTIADLVAQAETLSESELAQLFMASAPVMAPFALDERGVVIISSVAASGEQPPRVLWQRHGAGQLGGISSILGAETAVASLPQGFLLRPGESVVVGEVFYDFSPLFMGVLIHDRRLYQRAMFRPRFGALTALGS